MLRKERWHILAQGNQAWLIKEFRGREAVGTSRWQRIRAEAGGGGEGGGGRSLFSGFKTLEDCLNYQMKVKWGELDEHGRTRNYLEGRGRKPYYK